jgi:hypothetical protein
VSALTLAAKKLSPALPFDARDKHQQSLLHVAAFAGDCPTLAWLLALKKRVCVDAVLDVMHVLRVIAGGLSRRARQDRLDGAARGRVGRPRGACCVRA